MFLKLTTVKQFGNPDSVYGWDNIAFIALHKETNIIYSATIHERGLKSDKKWQYYTVLYMKIENASLTQVISATPF